jgi:hypothetical protein
MLREHQERTNDLYLDKKFTHDFDPEEYKPVEPGNECW